MINKTKKERIEKYLLKFDKNFEKANNQNSEKGCNLNIKYKYYLQRKAFEEFLNENCICDNIIELYFSQIEILISLFHEIKFKGLNINLDVSSINKESKSYGKLYIDKTTGFLETKKSINNTLTGFNSNQKSIERKIYKEPFFANLVILKNDKIQEFYIGRKAYHLPFIDVVDWRSDLANIYYLEKEGRYSENKMRQKIIQMNKMYTSECILKKMIMKSPYNSKTHDHFLLKVLEKKRDLTGIQNIVSTIQKKQYTIVASSLKNNIFVSGCAGSGKTMILAHRVSYHLYKNKNINSSVLILAPNKLLLNNIGEVLEQLNSNIVSRYNIESLFKIIGQKYGVSIKTSLRKINEITESDIFKFESWYDTYRVNRKILFNTEIYEFFTNKGLISKYNTQGNSNYIKEYKNLINTIIKKNDELVGIIEKQFLYLKNIFKNIELSIKTIDLHNMIKEMKKNTFIQIESSKKEIRVINKSLEFNNKEVKQLAQNKDKLKLNHSQLLKKMIQNDNNLNSLNNKIKKVEKILEEINSTFFIFKFYKILKLKKKYGFKDFKSELHLTKEKYKNEIAIMKQLKKQQVFCIQSNKKINDRIEALMNSIKKLENNLIQQEEILSHNIDKNEVLNVLDVLLTKRPLFIEKILIILENKIISESDLNINIIRFIHDLSLLLGKISDLFSPDYNNIDCNLDKNYKKYEKYIISSSIFSKLNQELENINNLEKKYFKEIIDAFNKENSFNPVINILLLNKIYGPLIDYKYIFIDEIEDVSPIVLRVLERINARSEVYFNLFGDLNQKMCINGANHLKEYNVKNLTKFKLRENYRNTIEVTNYYNDILKKNDLPIGIKGKDVTKIKKISEIISINDNESYVLITKFPKRDLISMKNMSIELKVYNIFDIKGCEFTNVIVNTEDMSKNELYVSLTRALKHLVIIVDNNFSKL